MSLRPPVCRVGSKQRFAELLTHILPAHKVYVEPFAGSAAIFFYKEPAEFEVLNDLDTDITTTYRLIQKLPYNTEFPDLDTDEKVAAFHNKAHKTDQDKLVEQLIRACGGWMGKMVKPGGKLLRYPNPFNKLKKFKEYKKRLSGVHITNQDYEKVIKDNDSKDAVFFLDPPYEESTGLTYAKGSDAFDFIRFMKVVSKIKGKWLITINDSPYIRELFKKYNIVPVVIVGHHKATGNANTAKTIGTDDRPELLIANFSFPTDVKDHAPASLKFKGS